MELNTKIYTFDEVRKHNQPGDCWVIIDGKVIDVSTFLEDHPGGPEVLLAVTGKDATMDFEDVGHSITAREIKNGYCKGKIDASTIPTQTTYVNTGSSYHPEGTKEFTLRVLQLLIPVIVLGVALAVHLYSKKE